MSFLMCSRFAMMSRHLEVRFVTYFRFVCLEIYYLWEFERRFWFVFRRAIFICGI